MSALSNPGPEQFRTQKENLKGPESDPLTSHRSIVPPSRCDKFTAPYEQIRSGRLWSVTEGRTRLIPASAIREYIALLEREANAA